MDVQRLAKGLVVLENVQPPPLARPLGLGRLLELDHHALDRVGLLGELPREPKVGLGRGVVLALLHPDLLLALLCCAPLAALVRPPRLPAVPRDVPRAPALVALARVAAASAGTCRVGAVAREVPGPAALEALAGLGAGRPLAAPAPAPAPAPPAPPAIPVRRLPRPRARLAASRRRPPRLAAVPRAPPALLGATPAVLVSPAAPHTRPPPLVRRAPAPVRPRAALPASLSPRAPASPPPPPPIVPPVHLRITPVLIVSVSVASVIAHSPVPPG
mmetsp:Transcript_17664/g.42372  ORF Transcript_17664/g.42372 Transcript_17664/m.42372 type:complete len:274 (-) Transcript_17664:311-1132(-)